MLKDNQVHIIHAKEMQTRKMVGRKSLVRKFRFFLIYESKDIKYQNKYFIRNMTD